MERICLINIALRDKVGNSETRNKTKVKDIIEELVSKTSYIHLRHVTHLHY